MFMTGYVGQNAMDKTLTVRSIRSLARRLPLPSFSVRWDTCCLKAELISRDNSMSLNIPSNLLVKPALTSMISLTMISEDQKVLTYPHSALSLDSMLFSLSTLADFPTNNLFARSFL